MLRQVTFALLTFIASSMIRPAPSWAAPAGVHESTAPGSIDPVLREIIKLRKADGALGERRKAKTPAEDPLIKLGQILFFTKTLGGTFDSSCASCHHPDFAFGDGLSLAVGVAAKDPDFIGPGRIVEPALDNDPLRDGGPNVPRNSQTIINSGLYQRELFFDGRVEQLRHAPPSKKAAIQITTPDSNLLADRFSGETMLEAQARFPVTSADEMRNFLHPEVNSTWSFRALLVKRLRGEADSEFLHPSGPAKWLKLFQAAYRSEASAEKLITYESIQKAIAAYEDSLIFIDTPFSRYLNGERSAMSDAAKEGALLFFTDKSHGGLNCYSCHSGNFFSDEEFHNVGIPQFGRGKRADANDFGRWQVTKQSADKYAFRTPSLINVALTAPFGHSGAFDRLEDFMRYHVDPKKQAVRYDFSLQGLNQFKGTQPNYPNSKRYTYESLAANTFSTELPEREISDSEVAALSAFLDSLSSDCLSSSITDCLAPWVPTADEDPDGNLLVRAKEPNSESQRFARSAQSALKSLPYPHKIVTFKALESKSAGEVTYGEECRMLNRKESKPAGGYFFERFDMPKRGGMPGFATDGRIYDTAGSSTDYQQLLPAGGVSAGYSSDGCWPDLFYTSGNNAGAYILRNDAGEFSTSAEKLISGDRLDSFTSVGIADLTGSPRPELVLGNLRSGNVEILSQDEKGSYQTIAKLPMERNTYGISFGDYDLDGFIDMYLAHWDYNGLPGSAPALWRNNAGASLSPQDKAARLSVDFGINQNWQFTPSFADVDGDNKPDILLASDFLHSTVLQNMGEGKFLNVTDRSVITDENGMGSAVADFRNSGKLDWFVGAVFDPTGRARGNWGVHGNRMYRNESVPGTIKFSDVTEMSGVRDGLWSWGACAADFNNDGWLDILQVNGYGRTPPGLDLSGGINADVEKLNRKLTQFANKPSRLFINRGDGTFNERAKEWRIDAPLDGRGLVCFDYDRDGDIDTAILDRTKGVRIFENQRGISDTSHMLSLRLIGKSPNSAALGAKVYLSADLDGDGSIGASETQMRYANANSNFNSQNPPDMHFGLGKAPSANLISIIWPDGTKQEFRDVAGDQHHYFRQ